MRSFAPGRAIWLPVAALALLVVLLPFGFPSIYFYRVAALICIFALAAVGLNVLMGFTGQVSLGHAAFIGLGGYAVAIGPTFLHLPSWAAVIAGAALSALAAIVVGRPILRLRGHYLAVATLGFGILLGMVFTNESRWTGGPDGMPVPRLVLFGWHVHGAETWYWISAGLLVAGTWLILNLAASPTGRALRAIHGSEIAACACGIDVARYKLATFLLSAVYASIAGSALALLNGYITPDNASFLRSVEIVTMVAVGGLGSTFGAIVGAAALIVLPQLLTAFNEYENLLLGAIIIVFMVFFRGGIVPALAHFGRRVE